jgi:tetratricopeptide (TPR) repeat protein
VTVSDVKFTAFATEIKNASSASYIDSLDMKKTTQIQLIVCFVAAVLTVGLYWSTRNYDFVFDDSQNIVDNPHIQVNSLSIDRLKRAGFDSYAARRPLANWSFMLNYMHGELDPAGYRIVNIGIHIVNAALAYWLVFQLFLIDARLRLDLKESKGRKKLRTPAAIGAAAVVLIWIVHPLHVNAVTYVVQRMASMSAMFIMTTLCLYIYGRRSKASKVQLVSFTAAAVSWILAMLTKEIAITLPLIIFLLEFYFFRDLDRKWGLRQLTICVPVIVLGVLAVCFTLAPVESILNTYEIRDFNMSERVMTQWRVLIFYISLIYLPMPGRLTLDHQIITSRSIIDPITTSTSLFAIIGLLALAVYLARNHRLLSFCIFFYFISLSLESSIIALEMAYEHRLYLVSLTTILAVAAALRQLHLPRVAGGAIVVVLTGLLALSTHERNKAWETEFTLWEDCVRKAPRKARPHYNLGNAYFRRDRFGEAVAHYENAVRLDETHTDALCNMGVSYAELGKPDNALEAFEQCIEHDERYIKALVGIGQELGKLNRLDEALENLLNAVALQPSHGTANEHLGYVYTRKNDRPKAIAAYRVGIAANRNSIGSITNLGILLAQEGKTSEAINALRHATSLDPTYAHAQESLGFALDRHAVTITDPEERKKIFREAIGAYQNVVRLRPGNAKSKGQIRKLRALLEAEN